MTIAVAVERPWRAKPSSGAGDFAVALLKRASESLERLTQSALVESRLKRPLSQLGDAYLESLSLAKFEGTAAPSTAALEQAQSLIENLPGWAPAPHPVMEADGTISLEWDVGGGRFYVLALDGTGHIDYSAIVSIGEEHYGRTPFKGGIPAEAAYLLSKLIRP